MFNKTPMMLFAMAMLGSAGAASAQTGADLLQGPPVPGVCMLSQQAVFANSKIGVAASARLHELATQEQSRLAAQGKPLQADIDAFRTKAASLKAADRDSQGEALDRRMNAFKASREQSLHDLEATRAYAMNKIGTLAQPILGSAFKANKCGLLLNRDAVLGGNTSNDLTTSVVRGLDAKVTTIQFDLQHAAPVANPGASAQ